jgi:hypothetical protein
MKIFPFHNKSSHDLFPFIQFLGLISMIMGCVFVIALSIVITTIFYFLLDNYIIPWQMWHPHEIVQFDYCD